MIAASGLHDSQGSWSQQFTFDGFGNLTQKIGTNAPNNLSVNVDPTTNRLTGNGAVYDANGNLTQYTNTLANITFTYDMNPGTRPKGRMISVNGVSSSAGFGTFAPRARQNTVHTIEEVH